MQKWGVKTEVLSTEEANVLRRAGHTLYDGGSYVHNPYYCGKCKRESEVAAHPANGKKD